MKEPHHEPHKGTTKPRVAITKVSRFTQFKDVDGGLVKVIGKDNEGKKVLVLGVSWDAGERYHEIACSEGSTYEVYHFVPGNKGRVRLDYTRPVSNKEDISEMNYLMEGVR